MLDPETLRTFMVQMLNNAANLTGPFGRHLIPDDKRAFLTGFATYFSNKCPAAVLADMVQYVPNVLPSSSTPFTQEQGEPSMAQNQPKGTFLDDVKNAAGQIDWTKVAAALRAIAELFGITLPLLAAGQTCDEEHCKHLFKQIASQVK